MEGTIFCVLTNTFLLLDRTFLSPQSVHAINLIRFLPNTSVMWTLATYVPFVSYYGGLTTLLFFDYVDDIVILPSDNLLAKSLRSSYYVDDKVLPPSDTLLAESPRSYFPIYIGKIKATPLILAYISQYVHFL